MFWADKIAEEAQGPQVINDSKTPSGLIHVGAIRGVAIHYMIYKAMKDRGRDAAFLYGIDDYDPMDSLPVYLDRNIYAKYMGVPLSMIPAPDGSSKSFSDFYADDFIDVVNKLGMKPQIYYMHEYYKSGKMNKVIDVVLRNDAKIREIYARISGAQRTEDWLPFQVVCEKCGKIGTTRVFKYDGEKVYYKCEPEMVVWAAGCGHEGSMSPFDGNGKLPWKLEWVGKWIVLGVTIEGAGKDHSAAGGSREVSEAICREVFNAKPPLNVPYEFFIVGGKKMSSSRGVGASCREMYEKLPPEILRLLMLRKRPETAIDFSPDGDSIPRLMNDYDEFSNDYFAPDDEEKKERKRLFEFIAGDKEIKKLYLPQFTFVAIMVQLPHVDMFKVFETQKGSPLTKDEIEEIEVRAKYARVWLENFASEGVKFKVQEKLPDAVSQLSPEQIKYLESLADALSGEEWNGDKLQTAIFTQANSMSLPQGKAFQAIYSALLGRPSGPRAGWLIAALDKEFVTERFSQAAKSIV
ncbi:MAG: lysine--tRNA ligase [Firmicutes bacterium]|nr:lysine--tRNA ligase [Bacillota bacterium]